MEALFYATQDRPGRRRDFQKGAERSPSLAPARVNEKRNTVRRRVQNCVDLAVPVHLVSDPVPWMNVRVRSGTFQKHGS